MLHSASVSGQHSSFSSGRWASSSSLVRTGRSPCAVRTLAMVPPVVIKSKRCLDMFGASLGQILSIQYNTLGLG